MNYKISLLLFFTIFILTPIFALDCQYTQSVFDHTETIAIPYSIDDDDPIELITFTLTGTTKAPIYFFNENDFNVDIEFDLLYYIPGGYTGNLGAHTNHILRTIIPGTSEMAFGYSNGYYSSISNLAYRENDFVYLKNKEKSIFVKICKLCGDVNCLDDGVSCSKNAECGSGNCIRGLCSSGVTCYNNDCNCATDEIQFENKICIKKQSVAIGGTPITKNPEECISNYISSVTGNCAIALGDLCTMNLDCAENYCVMGTCSTNPTICYNNNCNCKGNEIQFENRICILKNSVDSGEKTITGNKLECKSNLIDKDTNICKLDCNDNQISYNYGCINKKTAKNGVVPQTGNREECKSEYIDPKTGKCAMTSENLITIMIVISLFLIFGGGFLYYLLKKSKITADIIQKKLELAKEERIKAELEYETAKTKKETSEKFVNKISKELDSKINDQKLLLEKLKQIEKIKDKTHVDLDKLSKYKDELKELSIEIKYKTEELKTEKQKLDNLEKENNEKKKIAEETLKIIKTYEAEIERIKIKLEKPHRNKQNYIVKLNKFGYEERLDGISFHRWWFEKNNGKIKSGNVIHHIDGDKLNNDISNLIELTQSQHDRINHDNIRFGNRGDGLKELKKNKII